MTLTSGVIGALLAAELGGHFGWRELGFALLAIIGLLAAHATNNLINDYVDTRRGVDTEDYPRGQYATHPLLGGLTTPNRLLAGAALLTLLDVSIMLYLASVQGPLVIAFAVSGFLLSMGYTSILKRFALGELTALVVWGPLMIAGTYYSILGELTPQVWWASLPYGLIVASVLIGKHIDKMEADGRAGIHSLPVILGQKRAIQLLKATFILFYLLIFGLVFQKVVGFWILVTVLAGGRLRTVWLTLSLPKPKEKPENWPVWPLWYVAWSMYFNRAAGMLFILGLIFNIVARRVFGQ
jgi:1,4-dihydroxy-2-naphthoate octaprenyltransferase